MDPPSLDVERLGRYLDVLATPARLRLLAMLRVPRTAAEVLIPAGEERGDMRAERPLSRTTIIHHLSVLESERLVLRDEATGRYVLNREMLFLVTDALGELARLEPIVPLAPRETIRRDGGAPAAAHGGGPRLVHVGGPFDGETLALAGAGPWTLGRAADAELRVDYDPQVSRRHARLRLGPGGVVTLAALPEATNPILVDGVPALGIELPLRPGSVLAVGATRLVFQT